MSNKLTLVTERLSLATFTKPGNFVLTTETGAIDLGNKLTCFPIKNKMKVTPEKLLKEFPRLAKTYTQLTLFILGQNKVAKYSVFGAINSEVVEDIEVGIPIILKSSKKNYLKNLSFYEIRVTPLQIL